MVGDEAEMSGREITANMVRKVVKKGEMVPQVQDLLVTVHHIVLLGSVSTGHHSQHGD